MQNEVCTFVGLHINFVCLFVCFEYILFFFSRRLKSIIIPLRKIYTIIHSEMKRRKTILYNCFCLSVDITAASFSLKVFSEQTR